MNVFLVSEVRALVHSLKLQQRKWHWTRYDLKFLNEYVFIFAYPCKHSLANFTPSDPDVSSREIVVRLLDALVARLSVSINKCRNAFTRVCYWLLGSHRPTSAEASRICDTFCHLRRLSIFINCLQLVVGVCGRGSS